MRTSKHIHRTLRGAAALTAALALLLAAALPLAAQDEEGFSEGFSVESEESGEAASSEEASGTESGGETGFSSFGTGSGESALEWGGFLKTAARYSANYGNLGAGAVNTYPELGLNLTYRKDNSEAVAELRFSRNWSHEKAFAELVAEAGSGTEPAMNFKWYLQRMINQAYLQLFYDGFDIQAGFLKEVWGTGDQVHVVDPLNPTDYYDFVNVDYMERKVAEFMFKANVRVGDTGSLELVYAPTFTPDAIPQSGDWVPAQVKELMELEGSGATLNYPSDSFMSLDDGQYAARLKGTLGGVDLGAVYYFGRSHQPVVTDGTYVGMNPTDLYIDYPRLHLFGLESAAVLGGFNLRAEAAFTMTDDWETDDPYESREDNPALHYVAGFDRDLGISNLNLNIQGTGAYYWNAASDAEPLSTTVSAALTDSWDNGKIDPELSFAYHAEGTDLFADPDLMVRPKVAFTLVDDVSLEAEYAYFWGPSDGYFGQFEENDYLQLTFDYAF
jgi:hypothetical protein